MVIIYLLVVFVAITWSLQSTSFFLICLFRVALTLLFAFSGFPIGLAYKCEAHPLWFFGFSDKLLCVPYVFSSLLYLCQFLVWCQQNDYHFCSVPPSALMLLSCLEFRASFYLPLFFKRYLSFLIVPGGSFKLNF